MIDQQLILDVHDELVIDNFAGGGGASTGIELALGRHVDVAINHDPQAVAMHRANHPQTEHHCESVWDVDPRAVHPGRPIGLLWLSPDCKHFSKAKGGKPVEKRIRALAWVALRWVAIRRPRVLMLENVEEFTTWGPVVCGTDGACRPCPKRKGREFRAFVNALRRHGYEVEWRELRACDYGAPTIRKRLFLVARCDRQPIRWPEPTHGDPASDAVKHRQLKPWRTAAECIDWSLPCPSIFERARPLADATLRRVAKGVMRYVVNAAEPFIVPVQNTHGRESQHVLKAEAEWPDATDRDNSANVSPVGGPRGKGQAAAAAPNGSAPFLATNTTGHPGARADEPLRTIATGGHHAVVSAFIAKHYGGVVGADLRAPAPTITSVDHNSLVAAHITKFRGESAGHAATDPMCTVTANSFQKRPGGAAPIGLVISSIAKLRGGGNIGQPTDEPLRTISASGTHFAEVRAFLTAYYGTDQDPGLRDPLHTVTTRDRYALVRVAGQQYAIADIGLRMLAPRELFAAQGFPAGYVIDHGIDERGQRVELTKTAQVRMCGNSVCPPVAAALVRANLAELAIRRAA